MPNRNFMSFNLLDDKIVFVALKFESYTAIQNILGTRDLKKSI